MSADLTIDWDNIVEYTDADLQACYELGLLAYPDYRPIGHPVSGGAFMDPPASPPQQAWDEGWNDAKDLADCEHFDHSPQKRAMGMTI